MPANPHITQGQTTITLNAHDTAAFVAATIARHRSDIDAGRSSSASRYLCC